jgi:hypothetical protein
MSCSTARAIVRAALELRRTHPHAPALDILDLAVKPHRGSSPEFADGSRDLTDPDIPFGVLLREAFAGHDWQSEVLPAFFERYEFGAAC